MDDPGAEVKDSKSEGEKEEVEHEEGEEKEKTLPQNPERPYSDGTKLPEREITQTDHLNAKLLSAFDKLLSEGNFKIPNRDNDNDGDWDDDD